jgi:hypothetical protein
MQNIENILIQSANEQKIIAPSDAWPFIADALRKRKRRRMIWFFLSFFICLLISTGALFLHNNKNQIKNKLAQVAPLIESYDSTNNTDTNKSRNAIKKEDSILSKTRSPIPFKADIKNCAKTKTTITSLIFSGYKNTKKDLTPTKPNEDDMQIDKIVFSKKIKSRTAVKIKKVESEEEESNEKLLSKQEETKDTKTAVVNNIAPIEEKIDTTQKNISTPIINTEKTAIKKTEVFTKEKIKKWSTNFSVSYGALYISSKNLFKDENKALNNNNSPQFIPIGTLANLRTNTSANYLSGKEVSLSLSKTKEAKRFQPMFGVNINMGSFNIKAYNASSAVLDALTLSIDSSQIGNSNYATTNSLGSNLVKIKNNFLRLGVLVGCNIPIYTFKNDNKILLQAQVIPSYNLSQSIQWYDYGSTRYFTTKKISNNFNITQSTALLWQSSIKNRSFVIGPYFNFNYFKLNKTVNNISNVYTQTIGAKIQIYLKK